jgi:hypothetical protein
MGTVRHSDDAVALSRNMLGFFAILFFDSKARAGVSAAPRRCILITNKELGKDRR